MSFYQNQVLPRVQDKVMARKPDNEVPSRSTVSGVPSESTCPDARSSPQAARNTRTTTTREAIGSARRHPVVMTTTPAIAVPMKP